MHLCIFSLYFYALMHKNMHECIFLCIHFSVACLYFGIFVSMSDSNGNRSLTPEQLESVGKALYGNGYKIQLAEFLGVDRRRINHWLDGDRPIPTGITSELFMHAQHRQVEVTQTVELLKKILDQ